MKPETFEQFVAKYLSESRGMLNESKMMFQNADITVSTKVIEKSKFARASNAAEVGGVVMYRFSVSDLGTFDVIARGGEMDLTGTSVIDNEFSPRPPKFTRGAGRGSGFKTIVTVTGFSGGIYPNGDGPGPSKQDRYFLASGPGGKTISLHQDNSDRYEPYVQLVTPKRRYDFLDLV